MKDKSDEQLVMAVQNGVVTDYAILVRRYERPLIAFAMRVTGDRQDAEEAVQDAFLNIYRTIERVDCTRRFSTYLFAAVRNAAVSMVRGRPKALRLYEHDAVEDDMALYDALSRWESGKTVRAAVATLPPKQRAAIALYYFRDLSYKEIARHMRLPVNTVRTHLNRAKSALRKELLS